MEIVDTAPSPVIVITITVNNHLAASVLYTRGQMFEWALHYFQSVFFFCVHFSRMSFVAMQRGATYWSVVIKYTKFVFFFERRRLFISMEIYKI